jgi:hypothetical protein
MEQNCINMHHSFAVMKYLIQISIALGYRLDDWGSRVQFPSGAGNFSLHHYVRPPPSSTPPYAFMVWYSVKDSKGVTLTFPSLFPYLFV